MPLLLLVELKMLVLLLHVKVDFIIVSWKMLL